MEFDENDQIEYSANKIIHESAGGFVFFEDPKTHELFVPLLKTITGQYVIPKGHLKKDETPEAAAIREITEELTLDEPVLEVVSFLGVNSYEFTLKDDGVIHQKNVHLYVFQSKEKVLIKPLEEEGFVAADWLLFDTALEKISFDKENLLKARQSFYFDKRIRIYNNLSEITSITIGIPTYNGSKTIENTLSSVIERSVELPSLINLEVIVCTDHCTDNTKELIEKFMHEKNHLQHKKSLPKNSQISYLVLWLFLYPQCY